MNRFALLVSAAAALALIGCRQADTPATPASEAASTAAPDAKPGLSLSGGRLILPAVKNNPGAAYFSLTNGSSKTVAIAAVDVAGAGMTMLHETTQVGGHSSMGELKSNEVKPGETITFAPGAKHVMVDAVPADLKPGGTVEMTITFAGGDKISGPLTVEAPGGGT